MILLYVAIFFIMLIGLLVIIYYKATNKRHKKRLEDAKKIIDCYEGIPLCIKNVYLIICQRRYEHIMTFFNFQLVNKVFGFLSIVFALITFASPILKFNGEYSLLSTPIDDIAIIAISFLSILCVIIALYASPNRRVAEYIYAWRVDERTINEMTAKLDKYPSLPLKECQKDASEYMNRISAAEEDIHSDED